jgi:hypothetical protein
MCVCVCVCVCAYVRVHVHTRRPNKSCPLIKYFIKLGGAVSLSHHVLEKVEDKISLTPEKTIRHIALYPPLNYFNNNNIISPNTSVPRIV